MAEPDYFGFFGIEPALTLDSAALQKRFYELSRQWHPDRFASRPASEQALALENTALLNDAFRTLRDPVGRAEYVLSRNGFETAEPRSKEVPADLLEEVFEMNMALDELRGGEVNARQELEAKRTTFLETRESIDGALRELFAEWDRGHSTDALGRIRATLNRRKYIANLVSTVEKALAEQDHGHVSN